MKEIWRKQIFIGILILLCRGLALEKNYLMAVLPAEIEGKYDQEIMK